MLPAGAHPAAPLVYHTAEHGIPVNLPLGVDEKEKEAVLCYGTHNSALKEADFIHVELA